MTDIFSMLPGKSAFVVIGPPLGGKKRFVFQYLKSSLKKGLPVVFLSTDSSSEDVKRALVRDRICKGVFRFIDCYSLQAGDSVSDTDDIRFVSGPLALNEISIALAEFEKEFSLINVSHLVVFDSLSTLLMYSNASMVGRFLQVLIAKIRASGGSIIFTLEQGMHDPKDMVTLEHLMNSIIHVKYSKNKHLFMAQGIEGFEDWVEY